ncbi:MAG TPA: MerR family transcriptional regulator, partial [Parvularculaceae bacterium]|nr:MerR family transcriptional regulator [Parvularculaceae bacterium]
AFRTISEASSELDVPQHVLRHWEEVFGQIRPMRRAGGRRYYRPIDLDVLRGVRVLLYKQRYTTKGVQKIFKENGVKYVAELGRMEAAGQPIELRPLVNEEADDREEQPSSAAPELLTAEEIVSLSPAVRAKLEKLLSRLERAQAALDDAAVAIEAIDAD